MQYLKKLFNANTSKPLLSVIVPIYNCRFYLKQCLQSIQSQTLKNIEIICVDDGSTDKSIEIAKYFEEIDSRFKVIEQKNLGCYEARKTGLRHATGKYCGFVDADDYIPKNYFAKLYYSAVLNDSDIALTTRIIRVNGEQRVYLIQGNGQAIDIITTSKDRVKFVINHGIIWNRIYKTDFAKAIAEKFYKPTLSISEDNFFSIFAGLLAHKITVINNTCYYWRINRNSITHSQRSLSIGLEIYKEYTNILDRFNILCYKIKNSKVKCFNTDIIENIYKNKDFYISSIIEKRSKNSIEWLEQNLFSYFCFICKTKDFSCLKFILKRKLNFYCYLTIRGGGKINSLRVFYSKIKKSWHLFLLWRRYKQLNSDATKNINKKKKCSILVSNNDLVIVLSSCPQKIKNISYSLLSLCSQSLRPHRVELWLSEVEFKQIQGNTDLPNSILELRHNGLNIFWTDYADSSYFNILTAIHKLNNNKIIITANDSVIYYKDWLKDLYTSWQYNKTSNIVYCNIMHKILVDTECKFHYIDLLCNIEDYPSTRNLPINIGGVIYPPKCFYCDINKFNISLKPHKNTIDIWLWAMLVLNGWKVTTVQNRNNILVTKSSFFKELSLQTKDGLSNIFKIQLNKILEYYPQIKNIILNETV